jgi:hypothetical protein
MPPAFVRRHQASAYTNHIYTIISYSVSYLLSNRLLASLCRRVNVIIFVFYINLYTGVLDMPPSTPPRRRYLTRDQRIQVQTLRGIGLTYEAIVKHLGFSY